APSADARPVDEDELSRFQCLLEASWQALEQAAQAAAGKELRKGPRGGGRELEGILNHVLDAQAGYLSQLAWKLPKGDGVDLQAKIQLIRRAVSDTLALSAHGGVAATGPRGGARWTARYFARRSAWHILDHAWEIEDRII
ncbi:MAG TPA: hypothetical protein VIV15_05185, partial [Anaerolineales bacterium]